MGIFVSVADHGAVAVALPSIADEFRTDLPTVQWVMIAYALTIGSLLLPMGRLSDIVGRKRLYLVGFAVFLVAALLCAVGGSIVTLIGSRVLMGLGASMTQATSTAILLASFGESERGKALGLQISAVGAGAVGGPPIGGLVVELFGWREVFLLTAALTVAAIVFAQVVLDRRRTDGEISAGRFDLVGAVTSTAVLVVFLLAMSNGAELGWRSTPIAAGFAAVVGLAAFFTYWELRNRSPMLWLIVLGTVTQSVGTGTFNPPSNSSILSVVDRSSYGAMSGFLNLVRNSANITGIAVVTTIVVTVMGAQGFEPSLAAVSGSGTQGVLGAFTSGMKTAYLSMAGLAFAGAMLSMLKARRTA